MIEITKETSKYELYNLFTNKDNTQEQKKEMVNSMLSIMSKKTKLAANIEDIAKNTIEEIIKNSNHKLNDYEILYMIKSLFEEKDGRILPESEVKKCLDILLKNNCITNETYEFLKVPDMRFILSDLLLNTISKNITEFAFDVNDTFVKISRITNGVRCKLLKIINKSMKNEKSKKEKIIINTTLVDSYNDFILTSKETKFQKYDKGLELVRLTNDIKTKDTEMKHSITYYKTVNGKKIKTKKDGCIVTSFQSPLDWLDTTYQLNLTNTMTDKEILEKVETTKFFEIKSEQEIIYNAVCALMRVKSITENKDTGIFISFNELHKQLGYKDKLRPEQKEKYKNLIYSMSYLHTNISLDKCVYANHKAYYEVNGNIEKEPLVIYKGFCRAKADINKTSRIVDGFKTDLTELMKLHFKFTCQFKVNQIEVHKEKKVKSRLLHASKLENYIKRLYFVSIGNNNYCIDLNYNTLFEELKEFNLDDEYKQASHKTQFLKRKFLNPLNKMAEIKKAEILNNKIRMYFNKLE